MVMDQITGMAKDQMVAKQSRFSITMFIRNVPLSFVARPDHFIVAIKVMNSKITHLNIQN
jgi:polygalacturonase